MTQMLVIALIDLKCREDFQELQQQKVNLTKFVSNVVAQSVLIKDSLISKSMANKSKLAYIHYINQRNSYEITAALFGLAPETGRRGSVKNKGATKEEVDEEIDFEILAELETVVDLSDFGLTDV